MIIKTGLGQDSHKFDFKDNKKQLKLAGVVFKSQPPLKGNSDSDVVFHSITNAISSITGVNILGAVADEILSTGISDSKFYLAKALEFLDNFTINNIAISIEAKIPKIYPHIQDMRLNIADTVNISVDDIGITATSGEELTAFGRGEGIQVISIVTVTKT